jgi:hypothetical protein
MLCYACCAELFFELHSRSASPSLSTKSSSSVLEVVPFANVTNTPASRAHAAATPASQDDPHAAFGGKGAASRDASRRRSQGLESLQEQLQGVMMEGNQIQVGHVTQAAASASAAPPTFLITERGRLHCFIQPASPITYEKDNGHVPRQSRPADQWEQLP